MKVPIFVLLIVVNFMICDSWFIRRIFKKRTQKFGNTLKDCKKPLPKPSCYGRDSKRSDRTLDGTCNNYYLSRLGSAFQPLIRFAPAAYSSIDIGVPHGLPSKPIPTPHEVSKNIFKVLINDNGNNAMSSSLHMTYGQFLDHDQSLTPNAGGCANPTCKPGSVEDFQYPCFPIKYSNVGDKGCTKFTRSFASCDASIRKHSREQVNVLSSYIDGSQVYGVNEQTLKKVRSNDGTGELRVTSENLLPFDPDNKKNPCKDRGGCFLAGDVRVNEHIALAGFHTIFVREHNRIAKELKILNPHWDGETTFQATRKIIWAILQHITYTEYVPTLATLKEYKSYKSFVDPSISNAFSTAAFRYGHSQIKNSWGQLDKNFDEIGPNVPLQNSFFDNRLILKDGIEPTFYGLVGNTSEEVDLEVASGIADKLHIPPGQKGHANLVAINIQRGRDHGLPGYNTYRRICKLGGAKTIDDLADVIPSKDTRDALQHTYGGIEHIDLFVGGLAEKHLPKKLVGETFSCIIKDQFERLRDGDRFFYKRNGVFTKKQLIEIEKVSMAKILCNTLNNVVSMQKDVFIAFQAGITKRHECSGIEGIDLKWWKDEVDEDNSIQGLDDIEYEENEWE